MKKLGLTHVKGLLLHGPPGCGKTLIAREIAKALKARKPKIVNGPEIYDKYVGGSEQKIRELFADAEKECVNALRGFAGPRDAGRPRRAAERERERERAGLDQARWPRACAPCPNAMS